MQGRVTVYGAYGHTGRFVVAELLRRGLIPILAGRDMDKLNAIGALHPRLEMRRAVVDNPVSLDDAVAGAAAVINCAGPFAWTAAAVIDAALRARIPYLDVAAELEANADTFGQYASRARDAHIVVMPAMAFYGGLGDLLATAAMGDWPDADEISVAYALSSWKPTLGTRATGQVSKQRRGGRRVVFTNNRMEFRTTEAPVVHWTFPAPIGTQQVQSEFTMADSVTIPRHLKTPEIRTYMTLAPLKDLAGPELLPGSATDESGRSSQTFPVDGRSCRRRGIRRARFSRSTVAASRTRDRMTPQNASTAVTFANHDGDERRTLARSGDDRGRMHGRVQRRGRLIHARQAGEARLR